MTNTMLEAELAVHTLKVAPTIITICELQYSDNTLVIPFQHNTYSDIINNKTTNRPLNPTDMFYLYDKLVII